MSEGGKSLDKNILDWLETQGYPLEMKVAGEFQKSGFSVFQSEFYEDPESGTSREMDVIASLQKEIGNVLFRVSLCIECKMSRDKPWILFTSPRVSLANPARVVQRAYSALVSPFIERLAHSEEIQSLRFLSIPKRGGYGVSQAFLNGGRDVPYAAIMSATKCVAAMVSLADQVNENQRSYGEIIFPIVVADTRLFECYLDEDGKAAISEIDKGILVWRNPVINMPHTIVRISTVADLPSLVQEAKEAASTLFAQEGTMTEALKEIREGKMNMRKALLAHGKASRRSK